MLKREETTLPNIEFTTATGGTAGSSPTGAHGGNGGVGRIHLDYAYSYTGTTIPTLTTTKDDILAESGGSFLLNFI